jgi:hypothetical protein
MCFGPKRKKKVSSISFEKQEILQHFFSSAASKEKKHFLDPIEEKTSPLPSFLLDNIEFCYTDFRLLFTRLCFALLYMIRKRGISSLFPLFRQRNFPLFVFHLGRDVCT